MVELMAVGKEVELVAAVDMPGELEEQGLEDMAVGKVQVVVEEEFMEEVMEVAKEVVLVEAVVMLVVLGLEVADMVVVLVQAVVMREGKGLSREVVDMALVEALEEVMPEVDMQVDTVEVPVAAKAEVTVAMLPKNVYWENYA